MLKHTLDTLENIDEKYHIFYTEKDGKFELDENLRGEDTTALKNAKEHEKAERVKLQKKLDKAKADAEAWEIKKAELEGRTEDAERLKQEALDRQKSEYEKAHNDEVSGLKSRIEKLTIGKLESEVAANVYVKPEVMDLKFIRDRIKLNDKDEAYVVDKNGATMDVADFISELKEDESMAMFMKAGSGQGGGSEKEHGKGKNEGLSDMQKKKSALKQKYPDLE